MNEDRRVEPRAVPLGGVRGITVHRTLPHRALPTVGAWCFLDHFGPTAERMTVLPHPHTGLQTVTWPLSGQIRHRDSLGNDVVLRPGELNLMTSGDGVSHSEISADDVSMHGVQLWVALPDSRRGGPADFEHLPDLPRLERDTWSATVMVGDLDGEASPARTYTPLMGAQLDLRSGTANVPVRDDFEHAVLAMDGPLTVDGQELATRELLYLAPGREQVVIATHGASTALLIGGEPYTEPLVMWWNFIGRTHDEVAVARSEWEAGSARFGHVDGHGGQVIPAPPMPGVRLTPRRRREQ